MTDRSQPVEPPYLLILAAVLIGAGLTLGFTPAAEWIVALWDRIIAVGTYWIGALTQ